MDVDKFNNLAAMLQIQTIPQTYLVHKGTLIDSFSGVQSKQKIEEVFQKAKELQDSSEADE